MNFSPCLRPPIGTTKKISFPLPGTVTVMRPVPALSLSLGFTSQRSSPLAGLPRIAPVVVPSAGLIVPLSGFATWPEPELFLPDSVAEAEEYAAKRDTNETSRQAEKAACRMPDFMADPRGWIVVPNSKGREQVPAQSRART